MSSAEVFEGAADIRRSWLAGLAPDPALSVSEWADRHQVALVDLKAAVAEHIWAGRGNPDGIHWNFEGHDAVAELMLTALRLAGVTAAESDG